MSVALPRDHRYSAGPASNGASPPTSPAVKDRFSQHHPLTHASLPPAAGSYLSVDNKISTSSRSFLNLTTSALSGVFGSQTSLAELAGDDSTTASGKNGDNSYPAIEKVSGISTASNGGTPKSIDNYESFLDDANRSLTQVIHGTVVKKRRGSMSFPNSAVSANRRQTTTLARHATLPAMTPNTKLVRLSFNTLVIRIMTLFACGVAFGELARHLHDNPEVCPHTLDLSLSDNNLATYYSLVWGAQGIVLGLLFPLLDWLFPEDANLKQGKSRSDWSSIIRAVSAFLGLGLGVRKLPWDSSEQVAALWGLLNPFLWYLFDGSRNGFILSALVAILGTLVFAVVFPTHLPQAELSSMYVSVAAWIASVFFCCSICFGNIGRRILSVEVSTVRQ